MQKNNYIDDKLIENLEKRKPQIFKQCNIKCIFFPNKENIEWEYNSNGLKVRKENSILKCNYDGHIIKNWEDACPYYIDRKSKDFEE